MLETLRKAIKNEAEGSVPEAGILPLDMAMTVNRDLAEKEKRTPKKKVQKIRRK